MGSPLSSSLLRLQVVVDADSCALARVLESLQNLNVLPQRVIAEVGINDILHITVEVSGFSRLTLIAGKIRQAPSIIDAH